MSQLFFSDKNCAKSNTGIIQHFRKNRIIRFFKDRVPNRISKEKGHFVTGTGTGTYLPTYLIIRETSVVDPKLFFSDPTFKEISDPDSGPDPISDPN